MRPLQHALLRGSLPETALGARRPRQALQDDKKAGGAEQYNANEKYTEAVAVAAEACAEGHEGPEMLHLHAGLALEDEGGPRARVRVPRDGVKFAHVSCLAEQAKILVAEVEENNLGVKVLNERWARWYTCSLCEQGYHGVVARARVGVLEDVRGAAGDGQGSDRLDEPAWERFTQCRTPRGRVVRARGRVVYAAAPWRTKRKHARHAEQSCEHVSEAWTPREALSMERDAYSDFEINGAEHRSTLIAANNYSSRPLVNYGASKKPSRCCAERFPRRGAFSEIVTS